MLQFLLNAQPFRGRTASRLLLNNLDVLEHCDATTLGELPLHSDVLAAVLSELLVDRLVFANNKISFPVTDDTDWSTTLDALCTARLAMFFADGIMIDVTHHIDHFAGYFLGGRGVAFMRCIRRDGKRRAG